ncbi:MAG: hypothetical protein A3B96_03890 [Candidatus Spechtbacteria bacterium RIFCSPHIGHO2_02_FULL_43_15b]|uniref:Uncharacterized protein n=1 Tax=Candidatus Spechtbacteria bacterium RIFCSPHIGHO2_01_FULL_43_30 TaxID=1802158 RepID=A0A1G2H884_9BACT|nr:MAG: hypothetical protein A2827_03405 [Candidatus Spechtbacteria bacterium RIFCSPHIGHO2_01_FULL_43_30]OGZ59149.1 MAG: hypothetical protein A3B96_03890 [Candidatus Spechtbacteria bacterium RIFCSPHIGHO2_02_FULL_43_15b]
MASFIQKRKRQKKLALFLVGSVFIGVVVLYFGFFRKIEPEISVDFAVRASRVLKEVKLNIDILADRRFLELNPYSRISTDIQTGRPEPFSRY